MIWIMIRQRQGITKDRRRLVEWNRMVSQIPDCLARIPFEIQGAFRCCELNLEVDSSAFWANKQGGWLVGAKK